MTGNTLCASTLAVGDTAVATTFNVMPRTAKYWCQKIVNPSFHPHPYGGFEYQYIIIELFCPSVLPIFDLFCHSHLRGLKFGAELDELIQVALWKHVQTHPQHTMGGYMADFNAMGIPIQQNFIK